LGYIKSTYIIVLLGFKQSIIQFWFEEEAKDLVIKLKTIRIFLCRSNLQLENLVYPW